MSLLKWLLPKGDMKSTKTVADKKAEEESENESESESENENENESGNGESNVRFSCEYCDAEAEEAKCFQSRSELMTHSMKCHPSVCLGCYELFVSLAELQQHLKKTSHEPPLCRTCCVVFASVDAKAQHKCRIEAPVISSAKAEVKAEVKSDNDSEPDGNDEDSDGSGEEAPPVNPRLVPYSLECMHCSMVVHAKGFLAPIVILRNHTVTDHPTVCGVCFEGFSDRASLSHHQESMKHKTWNCPPCGFMYNSETTYKCHLSNYHPKLCPFQCDECCDYGGYNLNEVHRHKIKYHRFERDCLKDYLGLPLNACIVCDYQCDSEFALMRHTLTVHPEARESHMLKCEECNIGFGRPSGFGFHLHQKNAVGGESQRLLDEVCHRFVVPFECELCSLTFRSYAHFLGHLRIVHCSSLPYHCPTCNVGFLDENDMLYHCYEKHNANSPFICDTCGKVEDGFSTLLYHMSEMHDIYTIPIVYCFEDETPLYTNLHVHTHFARNSHLPDESTRRSQMCNICGVVFYNIKSHMGMHMEASCKCEECGKMCKSKESLAQHMKVHQTTFICPTCARAFHSFANLQRHMVVHSGEKPFQCDICGLRLSQRSALQRHTTKVHPGGIMGACRVKKPRKGRYGPASASGVDIAAVDAPSTSVELLKPPRRPRRKDRKRKQKKKPKVAFPQSGRLRGYGLKIKACLNEEAYAALVEDFNNQKILPPSYRIDNDNDEEGDDDANDSEERPDPDEARETEESKAEALEEQKKAKALEEQKKAEAVKEQKKAKAIEAKKRRAEKAKPDKPKDGKKRKRKRSRWYDDDSDDDEEEEEEDDSFLFCSEEEEEDDDDEEEEVYFPPSKRRKTAARGCRRSTRLNT